MAKFVLTDCFISINAVDFSDHVNQVEVSLEKDVVDTTNFSGGGRESVPGLKNDAFAVTFQQDFAGGETNATLWALYDDETEFPVIVRPTAGAVSATNPNFTGTCRIYKYQPLSGKPGDLSETKVDFPTMRTGITQATS